MNYFHTKALENIKIQIPQMTDKETPTNKKVFGENVKRATKTWGQYSNNKTHRGGFP